MMTTRSTPRRVRVARFVVIVAATVAVLAACGSDADNVGPNGQAPLRVAAALYPIEEIVARVGGDRVEVIGLTPPGGDSHDVELSAKTLDDLADADFVFYLGDDFQPSVEDAVAGLGDDVITVDLLGSVDLLALEAADDEHGMDEADDEHSDGEHDPHVWTDPANMIMMARKVQQTLVALDLEHAAMYQSNTDTYVAELVALGSDMDAALSDCAVDTVVTSHEAFAYLLSRVGLEWITIAGVNPDDQPSAKELAGIAEAARRVGATTIFVDATVSDRLGRTIAAEIGADVASLDPIETMSRADVEAGLTYETIQRRNIATLANGLGCSS
jgi:zinc transport system substrate-binding protein